MSDSTTLTRSQLEEIISHLNECTDAYLFVFDLKADSYYISPYALKTFDLPASKFSDASQTILRIVYPDDKAMLSADLEQIRTGSKDMHSMEYRWLR